MRLEWRWLRAILPWTRPDTNGAWDDASDSEETAGRPDSREENRPAAPSHGEAEAWSEIESAERPPSGFRRPPSLEAWETLAERRIREAQERGEFDNLRGAGKPLNLDNNPYAGEWELGFHLLRQAGYTLPWIELGREIEADRAALRALLGRSSAHLRDMRQNIGTAAERRRYEVERERYRDLYLRAASELDRKLAQYSAEVPTWRMDQGRIPPDRAARQFDDACPPL